MRPTACSQAKWYCPLPPQFANWGTFPKGEGFVNNNLPSNFLDKSNKNSNLLLYIPLIFVII